MPRFRTLAATTGLLAATLGAQSPIRPYVVVGTGQNRCYDTRSVIPPPAPGQPFYGQDAQHPGPRPSYRDNGDGTVMDLNTGLMWIQARGTKVGFEEAKAGATVCRMGGHTDWRMPTIKELYSLIDFNGSSFGEGVSVPYLNTHVFGFQYGNTAAGERSIDCQDWSATEYLGTTMGANATVFGVNFADGRIKGYPKLQGARGGLHKLYVRYVRGNPRYGVNDFRDNKDGTVTDRATGLMWAKADSGSGMDWASALAWVQRKNGEGYLGHDDWRLPNAKELQSLVDYTRAPEALDGRRKGPAIAPVFQISRLPDGEYPCFWTSTTHLDGPPGRPAAPAVYLAFGRALGWMRLPGSAVLQLLDVHGAGAQRSDPKFGKASDYPIGRGPQGDVIRVDNYVRLVRDEH